MSNALLSHSHCPRQTEDTLQSELRGCGQKVLGWAEKACAGEGDRGRAQVAAPPGPRSAARSRPLAGMPRSGDSPGHARVRQCPGGPGSRGRRTPERTCCPGPPVSLPPSLPPAAPVLAARVARVTHPAPAAAPWCPHAAAARAWLGPAEPEGPSRGASGSAVAGARPAARAPVRGVCHPGPAWSWLMARGTCSAGGSGWASTTSRARWARRLGRGAARAAPDHLDRGRPRARRERPKRGSGRGPVYREGAAAGPWGDPGRVTS